MKFLKDGMTQSGDFSIVKIDEAKYGKIDFSRGLIRYASERFLDIELVTNTVTGLKIPLPLTLTGILRDLFRVFHHRCQRRHRL